MNENPNNIAPDDLDPIEECKDNNERVELVLLLGVNMAVRLPNDPIEAKAVQFVTEKTYGHLAELRRQLHDLFLAG